MNNSDVTIYRTPDEIRNGLVRQLYMPVRWVEIIEFFVEHGIKQIIECGPGKVLSGLNKRINGDMQLTSTANILENF